MYNIYGVYVLAINMVPPVGVRVVVGCLVAINMAPPVGVRGVWVVLWL